LKAESILSTSTVLTTIPLPKMIFAAMLATPLTIGAATLANSVAVPIAAIAPVMAI